MAKKDLEESANSLAVSPAAQTALRCSPGAGFEDKVALRLQHRLPEFINIFVSDE